MHGKKQACEKNTSSRWLYKAPHQKNPSNLPQPSFFLPYLTSCWGVPLLVNFLRYFAVFFPCETYLTGTLLYCTVVIDLILTVKSAAAASSSSSSSSSLH